MHGFAVVLRRLAVAIPTVIGVIVIAFVLTRLLPGDPAVYFAGPAPTAAAIADLRAKLLLDRPLPVQFAAFARDLGHGNLGKSLVTGQAVSKDLMERLPATLELTLCALLMALLVAIPLGCFAALRRGSWVDHLCRLVSTAAVSVPAFFGGLLLVFVFYYLTDLAPPPLGRMDALGFPPPARTGFLTIDTLLAGDFKAFRDVLAHLVLPAIALALSALGPVARMTRASMLSVLSSEFMRAARTYDLPGAKLLFVYGLRNALLPVVTTAGMVFSFLISSNVVIEKVFAWPGVGSYALEALVASDYAAVQGFVLALALVYVALNVAIDVLYGFIDVRVRLAS
jgi:peptide/nickel transport system permease protein